MTNGDEAMSPAEFAKLMGAYPQPAGNPLPTYGGYMDNSPANFSWVQNNDYFGAEEDELLELSNKAKERYMDVVEEWEIEDFCDNYDLDYHDSNDRERAISKYLEQMPFDRIIEALDEDDQKRYYELREAEGEKKNCGCGQDPCKTFGSEMMDLLTKGKVALTQFVAYDDRDFKDFCKEEDLDHNDPNALQEYVETYDDVALIEMLNDDEQGRYYELKESYGAESWSETDQYTIEYLMGYKMNVSLTDRVREMVNDEDIDLDTLEWFLNNMTIPFGDREEALAIITEAKGAETFEARGWREDSRKKYGIADTAYLIIDNSGSSGADFGGGLNTFKDSAKKTIDRLNKGVKKYVVIGMNGFHTIPRSKTYYQEFTDKEEAKKHISKIEAFGPTRNFSELLKPLNVQDGDYTFVFTDAKLDNPFFIHSMAETFEAPYAGVGSLFGIGQNTGLEGFTTSELTTSSAIHGDFDEASLNYSGHQNLEVRAEDEDEELEYPCDAMGCEKPSAYNFQDATVRWDIADDEFVGGSPKISEYGGDNQNDFYCKEHAEKYEGSNFYAETFEAFKDNPQFRERNYYGAEMNELTDSLVDVSNRFGESVGMIEVEDYEDVDRIEDVEITVSDKDGMKVVNTSLEDFYTPDDEDDYDFDTYESPKMMVQKNTGWIALASVALGTLAYFNRDSLTSSVKRVFNNETQEMLENDPELIENPNTGNLDPAQYEELVVQSTGYAVDVIPVGLDGSFMGSRFAALPTERYVEYNDPGIGAHTDIALNRDEMYLEPEMAMVQASENVVKEAQAPGQSPYNSITGEENPDFDYRVLKETHPVSLDPAVKPFIPQSMTGYTGNANTPPSVMNKMFNIGVLGQTPAFVPGSSDMGASHFGSRNATPNTLGLGGSVGGPLSDQVNASYTDGTNSMSLAQWAIENTVSQTSDTEAVVIDRSSGLMKRVRRV